jgi:exodeoxyribonuclease VII small subunit
MTPKKKADEPTFEEALGRLEEIVDQLEKGEAPLEKGLELFEEGVALSRRCHGMLETAEARIRRLVREEEGGVTLELFPGEEETSA